MDSFTRSEGQQEHGSVAAAALTPFVDARQGTRERGRQGKNERVTTCIYGGESEEGVGRGWERESSKGSGLKVDDVAESPWVLGLLPWALLGGGFFRDGGILCIEFTT